MRPIRLAVEGGPAGARMGAVEDVLAGVPGVLAVRAEPGEAAVSVEAADEVDPDALVARLREAGFTATFAG